MGIGFYSDKNSIYAVFRQQKRGRKINLKYYPGITLGSDDKWFPDKQRSSNSKINGKLAKIEAAIIDIDSELDLAIISTADFANLIESKIEGEKKKTTPFIYYAEKFIKEAREEKGHDYAKTFLTMLNKLREFDPNPTFEKINKKFYREFVKFLNAKKFSDNYIGSMIRDLKKILNTAYEDGINSLKDYEDFEAISEEVYNIYLTEEEIKKIYDLKIDRKTIDQIKKWDENDPSYYSSSSINRQIEALDRARKLFVIGCWTGLRVENYLSIDPDIQVDLENGFLHAIANKNGPKLRIPLHRMVREIVEQQGFPQTISAQKLNKHIKILGRLAGINDTIIYSKTLGGKRKEFAKKKYEMIVSHTARRSFASNLISRGIPKQYVMAVTGHSSEKSFNKYIAAVQKDILTEKMKGYDVWK